MTIYTRYKVLLTLMNHLEDLLNFDEKFCILMCAEQQAAKRNNQELKIMYMPFDV